MSLSITDRPSPNHGPRKGGARPDIILIHGTAMESMEAARDRLCDPGPEVSAHYLVGRDGTVLRLVPEDRRAWHAGLAAWGDVRDVNSRSIGIEIDYPGPFSGPEAPDYAEAAMAALIPLLAQIRARWDIPASRVLAHSDVAPGRKDDPGERFDWERLAAAGHAVPRPAAAEGLALEGLGRAMALRACAGLGYRWEGAAGEDAALEAARLRWAPGAARTAPGGAPSRVLAARLAALALAQS
ncbi:N-acetylmuramoyl-L-alanine amidase [Rhodovulum sp. DZ06]|uniref:N-acetylmuramoyl-L-alanine amidase n=1 Tax=Rhodovulum sp. DZ06 TaxID=3425126 RepID=UPI003D34DDC3